jgi:hypothetical protein
MYLFAVPEAQWKWVRSDGVLPQASDIAFLQLNSSPYQRRLIKIV